MKYLKTIVYKPVKCPYCDSKRTFIQSKLIQDEEAYRYHKCKDCEKTFRSLEE